MKIAICAIARDENPYFEEWLNYHRKVGISHFFLYDNGSRTPIKDYLQENNLMKDDIEIVEWHDFKLGAQSRAYMDCCKKHQDFDYIGFLDIDEFYESNKMNVIRDIQDLRDLYGNFFGVGLYWRIYGSNNPYFEERHPVDEYVKWHGDKHIKSFVCPKYVMGFPDPHKASLIGGNYINEKGGKILGPYGQHTSDNIWIKHVFTRSKSEFLEKIERGDANLQVRTRTMNDFYAYNDLCK